MTARNDDAAREPLSAETLERMRARAVDNDWDACWTTLIDLHATQAAAIARLEGELAETRARLSSSYGTCEMLERECKTSHAERDRAVLDAQAARREGDALKAGIEAALSEAWGRPMVRFNARKALRSLLAPTPSAPSEPLGNNDWRIDLWDAINEYATACGGDPGANVYGNTRRQRAVAAVERAARYATEPEAPSERGAYSLPALPTDPGYEDQLDALLASKSQGVRKVRPSEREAAGETIGERYAREQGQRYTADASAPPPAEPRAVTCYCAARGGALCECTAKPRAAEAADDALRTAVIEHLVAMGPCDDVEADSDASYCGNEACTYCALAYVAQQGARP
jgi:hypothetical protein